MLTDQRGLVTGSSMLRGWWRTKGLTVVAMGALGISGVAPSAEWKSAFLALAFAAFSADFDLGWITPIRWRVIAVSATTVASGVTIFAPRPLRLVALLALFAFWGVSLWQNSEPGAIVLPRTRT
jgi:hypothetical protein